MIKALLRKLFEGIAAPIERRAFQRFRKQVKEVGSNLWILDIDNTLADTWPNLKSRKGSFDLSFYENLPPLKGVIHYLYEHINWEQDVVVFLSARPFYVKKPTYKWLVNNKLINNIHQLYLVPDAYSKMKYFKLACNNQIKTVVVDDLSRNHENGKVLFYDKIIEELTTSNITYIGFREIMAIESQFSSVN